MKGRKKGFGGVFFAAAVLVFIAAGCASGGSARDGKETLIYQEGFEDSGGGWGPRGSETVGVVSGKAHSGAKSLRVSNRTRTWNGPIREFSSAMKPGQSYRVSVWVMFEEGGDTQGVSISIQQEVEGQGQQYSTIGAERLPRGEWTHIEAEYTVPRSRFESSLKIYVESSYKADDSVQHEDLFDFYIDDISVVRLPPAPPPLVETDIPLLYEVLPEIPLGAAIDYKYLDPGNIHHGLLRHFNAYVYGNEMKQDALEPSEGRFNWTRADALMDYAEKNGKKVRGHVLVWHSQVPAWLFQGSGEGGLASKDQLYARLENHIKTVAGRYRGRVDSWDVVNEAVGEDGNLRNSKYLQIAGGHEYIAQAFRWAREADPEAKLFINDYGVEAPGAKQDRYFKLVSDLLAEGVPIDGVGFQAHINISWPTVADLRNAIHRFAALGLKIQITEFDMSIYSGGGEAKKRADREILLDQAFKYQAFFDMFREEARAGNLDMVMVWGMADDDTWLNNHPVPGRTDYPLFFGKDLRAKPAYWVLVNPERLPIQIKKIDATRAERAPMNIADPLWALISPRDISDIQGNVYGWFKIAWTGEHLYVQAAVKDETEDPADGLTIFIEPENQKLEERSALAFNRNFPRTQAAAERDGEYVILAEIPFAGRLNSRAGFDLCIRDGEARHSWNDFNNSQEKSSINYGTINLRELPPVIYAKRGTVVIDGQIDPRWEAAEPVLLELKSQGSTEEGSRFRTLWDDEYVYVLVEVNDPVLNDANAAVHEQDSVEVFLDQNNGKTAAYESDDGQYRVNFKNIASFNGGDSERFRSRSRVYPGGYLVEMALPITAVKPRPGSLFGFDVQINDADASGVRTGIRNWANISNMGYQDTSGFGLLALRE
ncbi:MAG: endo-1,4-beta-xylanase [Spirochaetaceae bacterium]|jgi:endo-1,4-beta-xylanase|nr:endo-1,4-beta-xylanase [Spirochaetaceae bacterium]